MVCSLLVKGSRNEITPSWPGFKIVRRAVGEGEAKQYLLCGNRSRHVNIGGGAGTVYAQRN